MDVPVKVPTVCADIHQEIRRAAFIRVSCVHSVKLQVRREITFGRSRIINMRADLPTPRQGKLMLKPLRCQTKGFVV